MTLLQLNVQAIHWDTIRSLDCHIARCVFNDPNLIVSSTGIGILSTDFPGLNLLLILSFLYFAAFICHLCFLFYFSHLLNFSFNLSNI